MKKAFFLFLVLVLAVVYYLGFPAGRETFPFSKDFSSPETPPADGIGDLKGFPLVKPKESNPHASPVSINALDQLYQSKLDRGVRNIPLLSTLLIREGDRQRSAGRSDLAVQLALYAVKFSPDLPEAHFALAKARWRENPFQLHVILSEVVRAELTRLRIFSTSLKFFYNLFNLISNAVLLAFLVFGLVVVIKYLPLRLYDLRKDLSRRFSGLLATGGRILILFIPFLLRLDLLWAVFFWNVLLWGYATRREKQLIGVFLVVLVYVPFFLGSSSLFLDSASSDVLIEMNHANLQDGSPSAEQKLRSWLAEHPGDVDALFTLGLLEKRRGRYDQAEEFYRKAIEKDPKFHQAFSNLGNVHLAKKQPDLAVAAYQQAIHLNPEKGAYYFNLHRAYSQETLVSNKGERAFQKAKELDPDAVSLYLENPGSNFNRLVVDEALTGGRLWKRALRQYIGREGVLFRLFNAWFEAIPSRIPFLTPLYFLGFLIGVGRYAKGRRFLTRCPMCGSATYRFYLGTSAHEFVCFNCYRIFVQKEKLHPKIAEKKTIQVREFRKENQVIMRSLSYLLVGFDHLWNGSVSRGLLILIVFFVFVVKFIHWDGVIVSPVPSGTGTLWSGILWGGLFVLFYLLHLRHLRRLTFDHGAPAARPKGN